MAPQTRFVRSGGVNLAYQVFGSGPMDLIFVPGIVSHVDLMWDDPAYARFMRRLGETCRVITYDRRGIGRSDRLPGPSMLEERARDIQVIAGAAGAERPIVLGFSDGGPDAVMFAATHPERVRALILCCMAASGVGDEEQPGFVRPEYWERVSYLIQHWGDGWNLNIYAPTLAAGPMQRRLISVFERSAATSDTLTRQLLANASLNVKHLLPAIEATTLVLSRSDDFVPLASGKYVADHIPNARFEVIDGTDHVPFAGNANEFLTKIEDFMRECAGMEPSYRSMVATILFSSSDAPAAMQPDDLHELRSLLERLASDHAGRVEQVETASQVVVFDGPAAAVRCGLRLLQASRLPLRLGIHVGEITNNGGVLTGAAVHLAARVMQAAAPGTLLLSEPAADLLPAALFELEDLGGAELKGFPGAHLLRSVLREQPVEFPTAEHRGAGDRVLSWMGAKMPWQARAFNRLAGLGKPSRFPVASETTGT